MNLKKLILLKCLAAAAIAIISTGASADTAIVHIEQGKLKGIVSDHREFRGIPYGAPPVGELRFAAPQAASKWDGTRDASKFGVACPQAGGFGGAGSDNEDCLSLNVYTPLNGNDLPVMVWIHGGGLTTGSSASYDLSTIVKKGNVIAVSINYRLGYFGFLASPALAKEANGLAGNYGLLDQQLALQWVKNNIASFGGNPNNVTIFGESAGGRSVCSHLLSPGSKDLFHKAIMQSGPCADSILTPTESYQLAADFAKQVACPNDDVQKQLSCLRSATVEELTKAQGSANIITSSDSPRFNADGITLPKIDNGIAGLKVVNKVPVLKGSNQFEGRFLAYIMYDIRGKMLTEKLYMKELTNKFGAKKAKVIFSQYPPTKYQTITEALAAVYGDSSYSCPTYWEVRSLPKQGIPVYSYEFREPNPPSVLPLPLGPTHATELSFVLQPSNGRISSDQLNSEQMMLSNKIIAYWVNFARSGNPNGHSQALWKPYNINTDNFFSLSTDNSGLKNFQSFRTDHLCDFWKTISTTIH